MVYVIPLETDTSVYFFFLLFDRLCFMSMRLTIKGIIDTSSLLNVFLRHCRSGALDLFLSEFECLTM